MRKTFATIALAGFLFGGCMSYYATHNPWVRQTNVIISYPAVDRTLR